MDDELRPEPASRPGDESTSKAAPPEEAASLPRDIRSVVLTGIFVLLIFYTLQNTSEIAIPLVFAILLKLLLQPAVRALGRLYLPQTVSAIVIIASLLGLLGTGGYALSGPAVAWAQKVPQGLPRLEQQLSALKKPIERLQQAMSKVERITEPSGEGATAIALKGPGLLDYLFSGTRSVLTGFGLTLLMLFFMLSAGDLFMRRLVEVLPSFSDKKQAVTMSHEIESNISAYLVTITCMNALTGIATALAMWVIGLADPALWGVLAFVLNYVMILGPLTGVALLFLVALISFDNVWHALLAPAAYLTIHVIEGEWVTPTLVAKRFTLTPVLVIGSLIFWDWMWGVPGALLAVPMLAAFKIVCDNTRSLAAFGHFIGG